MFTDIEKQVLCDIQDNLRRLFMAIDQIRPMPLGVELEMVDVMGDLAGVLESQGHVMKMLQQTVMNRKIENN